jgi:threonylcarbamoyladenosine tRNA methylthiotransferase MtaB
MRKRLKVLTVGCKANFADSASVVRSAVGAGFDIVSAAQPADVVIINSCTVTHRADRDSRSHARRARRDNPGATVIFMGCYAQASLPDRAKIPEIDHWIRKEDQDPKRSGEEHLTGILREISGNGSEEPAVLSEYAAGLLLGHRRTFLKIQDGCDFFCSYCVVPMARGASRSVPEDEIVEKAVGAERDGARELVLTGVHIGLYGADTGRKDPLPGLIRRLHRETSRVRIRLSSIEPGELTGSLMETIVCLPRMCPHLHVPLQSGCDRTLERMRRPYRSSGYRKIIADAALRIPDICLGADVIAGFPGETSGDFEQTVRLLQDSPVNYLHVFPYSSRPGTESARWTDDVDPPEKKKRVSRLLSLDARMREEFLSRQIGRTVDVLAESEDPARGVLSGRSGNYAEVQFPGSASGIGEIHRVAVESIRDGKAIGTRIGRDVSP